MHNEPANLICGPPRLRVLAMYVLATLVTLLPSFAPVAADWVEFVDQTATRLVAANSLGINDPEERAFAWGDVDRDGDIDLVVARKQPFSAPGVGKRPNVLFLNEGGVLVDRTAAYASASLTPGDSGFLTPTNDRDVILVDVNLDGWLDIVTSTVLGGSDPKVIAYPRVYRNLTATGGQWLGFRHEDARIPTLQTYDGFTGFNPNFVSVAAGDVTGDGYPELYFTDHDMYGELTNGDFNDKLLVNQGAANPGFFMDATNSSFMGHVATAQGNFPFPVSDYGAAAAIVDLNGDEAPDIVKLTTLSTPYYLGVAYGNPGSAGPFDTYDTSNFLAPFYFSTGDLNQDDRLDLVITDDANDRYLLNQGNGVDGAANFLSFAFSFAHDGTGPPASDDAFGTESVIADVDNNGWPDVLITDISLEIGGCARRLNVYRNLGTSPGSSVVLQEQTSGSQCANVNGNPPSCIVAGVPASDLEGVHDAAVFDIDGDGWKDLVLGRCVGTRVFMNVTHPPAGGIPEVDDGGSSPLLLSKGPQGRVHLDWDVSCATSDSDYAVYRGTLGSYTSHIPEVCSTNGETDLTVLISGDTYFLVVPHNAQREGSYGQDSEGAERPASSAACHDQLLGGCD